MSERFSWAPFGPSEGDDLPPLPPLAPLEGEEPSTAAPELRWPQPDLAPDALPFEVQQELPLPPAPAPAPSASVALLESTAPPPPGGIAPDKRPRPQVRGAGDATAAFIWGLLGLTFCPVLIPSIIAVRKGAQAKAAGGGLAQQNIGLAKAGTVMGWIGIAIWTLVIVVAIGSA